MAHREELDALIEAAIAERASADWVATLQSHRVPSGTFMIHNEVRIHPQVKALGMLQWVDTPHGELRLSGPPWAFTATPAEIRDVHAPGQDTDEVLDEYGFGGR